MRTPFLISVTLLDHWIVLTYFESSVIIHGIPEDWALCLCSGNAVGPHNNYKFSRHASLPVCRVHVQDERMKVTSPVFREGSG